MFDLPAPLSEQPILKEDAIQILTDNGFQRTGKIFLHNEEWKCPKGNLFLMPIMGRKVPSDFLFVELTKAGIDPFQSELYRPLIFE